MKTGRQVKCSETSKYLNLNKVLISINFTYLSLHAEYPQDPAARLYNDLDSSWAAGMETDCQHQMDT